MGLAADKEKGTFRVWWEWWPIIRLYCSVASFRLKSVLKTESLASTGIKNIRSSAGTNTEEEKTSNVYKSDSLFSRHQVSFYFHSEVNGSMKWTNV